MQNASLEKNDIPSISAYIPCYNNAETVCATIKSIRAQSIPITELFVVDDGSLDNSVDLVQAIGVRVISMGSNQGRGSVRARAMVEAKGDLVLCCDATNILPPHFAERAITWFKNPKVAAVCSRINQQPARTAVDRWRGRHLFRLNQPLGAPTTTPLFVTYGAMVRRMTILAVGNFDAQLRHTEDRVLGEKLITAGQQIMYDPLLETTSIVSNSLLQVLERYIRWNSGAAPKFTFKHYTQQIIYALKVMVVDDLRDGDLESAVISFFSPHYELWWLLQQKQKSLQD